MKKTSNRKDIFVFADWNEIHGSVLMGTLHSERIRNKEIFSFEYEIRWLDSKHAYLLDPELQLYSGIQYLNDDRKRNFGIFLDSSPDRWGRLLMRRRDAAYARIEGREEQDLFEIDYLLGVFDEHRMGGLRFKTEMDGPFLNDNYELAYPPWTSIRELEQISLKLEEEEVTDDPEYIKWLNILLAPGSSLGGARPKANIVGNANQLWIAKFPSRQDVSDTGAWEMVVHELATAAGINKAQCQAKKFSGNHHTFLTRRFDRTESGERIHFASAMMMLGHNDVEGYMDGVSYLELVDFLSSHGANINEDMEELWRRIVFSICVSNTDDHLRNHGFLLTNRGWILSPAYDINPDETGRGLKLNISENDNSLDLNLALSVCEYFRLSSQKARSIIDEVRKAVSKWKNVASRQGITKAEQEIKSRAFTKAKPVE